MNHLNQFLIDKRWEINDTVQNKTKKARSDRSFASGNKDINTIPHGME
jgi:hypothetical protein